MSLTSDGYRSDVAGVVPDEGTPVVGGVQLPWGRHAHPDPDYVSDRSLLPGRPVLWISDDDVPQLGALWSELQRRYPQTGLWPLVLTGLVSDSSRPWDSGEFDPTGPSNPDEYAAEDVLREWWEDAMPDEEGFPDALAEVAPFGREFPGLAVPTAGPVDEDAPRRAVENLTGRLGLVAVHRPADAVAALGWTGPVNHYDDMALLAAVLRSWEDRFGAVAVAVGFDTLHVAVRRPASTTAEATAIAAEHLAFCPDNIWQGAESIANYAEQIEDYPGWAFWWD